MESLIRACVIDLLCQKAETSFGVESAARVVQQSLVKPGVAYASSFR